jgi:hypothetical protein
MGEHKMKKVVLEGLKTVDTYTQKCDLKNEISKYIKIALKTYKRL